MAQGPVASYQEYLSIEKQLEELPPLPNRPFMLDSDYPTGEIASHAQAKYELEQYERARDARQALSGYNADPWAPCGPLSPAQRAQHEAEVEEYRLERYGQPDSPSDMPARFREAGGRPFTNLKG